MNTTTGNTATYTNYEPGGHWEICPSCGSWKWVPNYQYPYYPYYPNYPTWPYPQSPIIYCSSC